MAHVLDPVTGQCAPTLVGLVGLHIVQKTKSRPQWIWSTFEQVDNVPPAQAGAAAFAFNNATGTPMPTSNPYPLDRVLQAPTASPFNVTRSQADQRVDHLPPEHGRHEQSLPRRAPVQLDLAVLSARHDPVAPLAEQPDDARRPDQHISGESSQRPVCLFECDARDLRPGEYRHRLHELSQRDDASHGFPLVSERPRVPSQCA